MPQVCAPRPLSFPRVTAILFVGDIVASAGRRTLKALLPGLREEFELDFVVANGENAAGGIGITPKHADELFAAGVDVITLGNHTYRHREVWPYLDQQPYILRPANFMRTQPGRGTCVFERDGSSLGVVNLSGNLFMQTASPAFTTIDEALREVAGADHVLVDMHAEATSEKVAMGWFLDGRVTAVVGTHTHVPTADARVLPGGTAYITRRRHDRRARRRHRRQARAVDLGLPQPHADALRRLRRRPLADGGRHPHRARLLARRVDRVDPAPGQQRDERQRQEPDEVEVEPVLQRELERDQRRGAERGDADRVAAARDEGDGHGEHERGGRGRGVRPGRS